ncbi:hypothetical protein D9615_005605 [Tricholomella constricta]|uniref:Autophagy-related protein 27 n=1 Tax=Tricholomella constricta TaxID=117010 RepID=A0A8H5HE86_9AGAR|nr:hypothetical protein D9615_005605 [Tricholomella constricta]
MRVHRPAFLTPSLLLLFSVLQVTVVDAAATLTHEFLENADLLAGCRFNLGRQIYDLCPLMHERGTREVYSTTWTLDDDGQRDLRQRVYSFVFGEAPNDRECPEGTWICMRETRGSINLQHVASKWTTHTPIAGRLRPESSLVDQGVNAVASILDDNDYEPSHLNLFFTGGIYEDIPRYARIEFICDHSSEVKLKSTDPSFTGETHGVHSFTWSTTYGCPIPDPNETPSSDSILYTFENEDTKDPPPKSDNSEPEEGEKDLVDPNFPRRLSRRWVAFVLLATGTFLIGVIVILASPHTRFVIASHLRTFASRLSLPSLQNHIFTFVSKPFQFRAGENRLVRWAQEDMSLGVLDEEQRGDVDVMVNGGSAFGIGDDDWSGEGMDEYIPLKAGLLRNKRDYGSARGGGFW